MNDRYSLGSEYCRATCSNFTLRLYHQVVPPNRKGIRLIFLNQDADDDTQKVSLICGNANEPQDDIRNPGKSYLFFLTDGEGPGIGLPGDRA